MRKLLVLLLVIVLAVGGYLFFPRGGELSAAVAATISVLRGDVDAQKGGAGDFSPALDGDLFASGDVVRSNEQGRAVLTFFDGSTVSVEPGSQVRVTELRRTGADGIQVTLEQSIGRTWASVQRLRTPDSKFELKTPTSTAVVRGTSFETIVEVVGGVTTTTIKTTEGEVVVRAQAGGETPVPAGTQVQVQQNQPAPPAPQPQPPTPRLQFVGTQGVSYVIQKDGHQCGSSANQQARTMPLCDVQGNTVVIGNATAGTYSVVLTAAQALQNAGLSVTGLRATTQDFQHSLVRNIALGELVRTSLAVTVSQAGALASPGFATPETLTSVCGAETRGRVFSSGPIADRAGALQAYGAQSKNQPAAVVVTADELSAVAAEGVRGLQGPATISGLAISIDAAGLHLAAQAAAGPITVPARGDVIAGTSGGKLLLRLRSIDLGPIPGPVKDQVILNVNKALTDFAATFPLVVERVSFRTGCMAIIGTTPP